MHKTRKVFAVFVVVLSAVVLPIIAQENLLIHEYPVSENLLIEAMQNYAFPKDLYIEVSEYTDYDNIDSTAYTIRSPNRDVFAGLCVGIVSHKAGNDRGIGFTFYTIDRKEEFSKEEFRLAIQFASYLFGGFSSDLQVYNNCIQDYNLSEKFLWEASTEDIDCQVIYTPELNRKLVVNFATNIDLFTHPQQKNS